MRFITSQLYVFSVIVRRRQKLKLDILFRLFEKDELMSPFFYMKEGTEKSHHTAAKDIKTKTMRDGGDDAWNMSSSYLDN